MEQFDIPVALFIFKRYEKTVKIVEQISKIQPCRLYLLADGPRNSEEEIAVQQCRENVEKAITWDCEVIKNYAEKNRGCYQNIAGGARWVFEREKFAIFLEDDNYPALSFFQYCKELLEKYEGDNRILWVCGTNYLKEYAPQDGSDYVFTKLMLPCGWASWADKFIKFYDGEMTTYRDPLIKKKLINSYSNKKLYKHNLRCYERIMYSLDKGKMPTTWDYQMAYAIRVNGLYGISPKYNQIRNIGADNDSIHGGVSMSNIMTNRFCELPTKELEFPLKHPKCLIVDSTFERQTERIIIPPLIYRLRSKIGVIIKYVLGIPQPEGLSLRVIKEKFNGK